MMVSYPTLVLTFVSIEKESCNNKHCIAQTHLFLITSYNSINGITLQLVIPFGYFHTHLSLRLKY